MKLSTGILLAENFFKRIKANRFARSLFITILSLILKDSELGTLGIHGVTFLRFTESRIPET